MVPCGLEGTPLNRDEFQEFRQRLIQEGHGPEVSLTIACRNLNEYIHDLEYQKSPELRTEIRDARNILKYLQHLLLFCGKKDPKAYIEVGTTSVFSLTMRHLQEMRMQVATKLHKRQPDAWNEMNY